MDAEVDSVIIKEMAWRDAVVSHVKNGVYGEMFAAAMLAWAPVSGSAEEVIAAGLSQIPSTSRLYESIREVLDWKAQGDPHDRVLEKLYERYDDQNIHHWDHTIPNAMIVAAALLYGQGDFGQDSPDDYAGRLYLGNQSGLPDHCGFAPGLP